MSKLKPGSIGSAGSSGRFAVVRDPERVAFALFESKSD
jgi:hypothetical protein